MKNPFIMSPAELKAVVPNFDPMFSTPYPSYAFDNNPFAAMRQKPGVAHPWLYAAVSTIIRNYIQCPLRMFDVNDPETMIEDHPLLRLLRRPNPSMSGTNFLESICWQILLPTKRTPGGQSFIFDGDGRANFRRGDLPDELWTVDDSGVGPMLTQQKVLAGWQFEVTDTSPYDYGKMKLLLDEVIRVNYFNPYAINRGLAPGNPLRVALSQDASSNEFNTRFFQNFAGLPGMLSSKTPIMKNQLDEARANFQKYFEGARNAGKIGFLPYDVEYKELSLSPADARYLESQGWNRDQILAAYQVSKFAVQQYEDLNHATAKEAKKQLFDNAIQPMDRLIMEELNEAWVEHMDRGQWRICADFANVAALRDDRELNWKCAEIAVMLGIPPLIALRMNSIPTEDLDEKKMPWLLQNQGPNAAFQSDEKDDPKDDPKKKPPKKGKTARRKIGMTREEKDALWMDYNGKVLTPGEAGLIANVRRYFVTERNRTLDLVDSWKSSGRGVAGTTPASFMLDKGHEDLLLRGMMGRFYVAQADRAQRYAQAQIRDAIAAAAQKDLTSSSTQVEIREWILRRLNYISEVNTTTFDGLEDRLSKILAQSVKDELTNDETARAIREGIQEVYQGRINNSKTIARTETGSVSSFVQFVEMDALEAPGKKKEWLASKDESGYDSNVRPTHRHADEQGPIDYDAEFVNGLSYPMQTGKPAAEVINCRCALNLVLDNDPFADDEPIED